MIFKNKKATNEVGIGIIVIALLLFVGGMFFDSDFETVKKDKYIEDRDEDSDYDYGYPYDTYLFFLNNTDIGRQRKVTESFPNIELGSRVQNNIIYVGSSFRLNSNPFSKTEYTVTANPNNPFDVNELLLYFDPERISGENALQVYVNGHRAITSLARDQDVPLKIPMRDVYLENYSGLHITLQLEKPKWYAFFNWNKMDITDLKVMEVSQDKANNKREFSFNVDKQNYLERVYLDLAIECSEVKEVSEAIKVTVNGFIIANQNPNCQSRYNTITANVPLNVLNNDRNELVLETDGFYKVAYGLNKIEFNDKDVYKFTINSFNDIVDVVMYGDFDKEVVDFRLNSQTFSLRRDEIKSIIPYLRFGTNELKILTKPVEIDELVIEKNEFLY